MISSEILFIFRCVCFLLVCIFVFGTTAPPPQWARASSFTRFLDHTQRRTTVGTTPLDKWSARRRDLYLITPNTHNGHPCPRRHSNPQSQQASGRRSTTLDRTATGTGIFRCVQFHISVDRSLFDFMRRFCVEAKLIVTYVRKIISET